MLLSYICNWDHNYTAEFTAVLVRKGNSNQLSNLFNNNNNNNTVIV
jgi:hypothetical protein